MVKGPDDHAHGGTGREDVVDEEEGGMGGSEVRGGGGDSDHLPGRGIEGVDAPQFCLSLAAGEFLTRADRA